MLDGKIPDAQILPVTINYEKILEGTSFTYEMMGETKIRLVEYSPNYIADYWCDKGHVIFVLEGELEIHYQNETSHVVKKGMSYLVGDDSMTHVAISRAGAKVLIID